MTRIAIVGAMVLCALGCETLDRFATDGSTVFHGSVVGDTADSFIRRGFPTGTTLDLEFDPSMAQDPTDLRRITTTSPDGTEYFTRTPLGVIESLEHDLLSQYDFPGTGRVRNYIYDARPTSGALAGRDVMVFISLMDDGTIEVRVVSGTGDESRGDVFGIFQLRRVAR